MVMKIEIDRIRNICYDLIAKYSTKFNICGYGDYSVSSKDNPIQSSLSHDEELESMSNFDLFIVLLRLKKRPTVKN